MSILLIVQQNQCMPTNCKTGPVRIQRRTLPLRRVRPGEERKHVHTAAHQSLGSWEERGYSLPLLGRGRGGGDREGKLYGVGCPLELDLGKVQDMECRQERERQEHESRQNKEQREKETEESVKEQNKVVQCKEQQVALSEGSRSGA